MESCEGLGLGDRPIDDGVTLCAQESKNPRWVYLRCADQGLTSNN